MFDRREDTPTCSIAFGRPDLMFARNELLAQIAAAVTFCAWLTARRIFSCGLRGYLGAGEEVPCAASAAGAAASVSVLARTGLAGSAYRDFRSARPGRDDGQPGYRIQGRRTRSDPLGRRGALPCPGPGRGRPRPGRGCPRDPGTDLRRFDRPTQFRHLGRRRPRTSRGSTPALATTFHAPVPGRTRAHSTCSVARKERTLSGGEVRSLAQYIRARSLPASSAVMASIRWARPDVVSVIVEMSVL